MSKTIGVIGVGSIGLRHAKNLKKLGHKVLRLDPPKGEHDDVFGHSDAFVIASPTNTHFENFVKCKGRPIFMEKPIADTDNGFISPDMITMVGYNLRFHSCVIKAKEWIDAGHLGVPIWGNLVCAQANNKYTDSVIFNWSHEIDLALYLLGPAGVYACVTAKRGVPGLGIMLQDAMADIVLCHNQAQSTVHLDYFTQPEVRQTIIVGSHATIIMDLVQRHAWLRGVDGSIIDMFEGHDSFDSNYVDEIESFIARIDGQETIGCTGQEGLDVMNICLEAKRLSAL